MQSGQQQSMEQGLRMSPQLRQGLRFLQAPSLELTQMLGQVLQTNPVLEMETEAISLEQAGLANDEFEGQVEGDLAQAEQWMDDAREERILTAQSRSHDEDAEKKRQYLMDSQSASVSLQQHLLSQLGTVEAEDEVMDCLRVLIELLDDEGRMVEDLEDLALRLRLPWKPLQRALELLQSLEPAGVGARNLQQALLLQAQRARQTNVVAVEILSSHFDLLTRNRRKQLARELRVPDQQVAEAIGWIRSLDPHPAREFGRVHNHEVRADVFVELGDDRQWLVTVPDDGLPKLRLSSQYKAMLGTTDEKTKSWLKEKLRDGAFVMRAVAQRKETLERVTREIVRLQPEWPRQGMLALRPMTMAQVAEALELHETTVSRAVAGKYVATPAGFFEMRRLFTTSLQRVESKRADDKVGEQAMGDVSSETVRQLIGEMVAAEDTSKPLSDSKLSSMLAARGVKVARRTVAKYREQLGISPSNLRRE